MRTNLIFVDEKEVEVIQIRRKDKYTWYCPTKECKKKAVVLFKTDTPYIHNGEIKCPVCSKTHLFCDIMKSNRKNTKRFFNTLENA